MTVMPVPWVMRWTRRNLRRHRWLPRHAQNTRCGWTDLTGVFRRYLSTVSLRTEKRERGTQWPPADLADSVIWVKCDLTDKGSADGVFARIARQLGGIDVLLHAAGLWEAAAPGEISADDLRRLLAVNLDATVFTNQAAYRHMKNAGGAIINLGSQDGVLGSPVAASYSMAKAAVHAWMRSAARAWGGARVTVNSVAPCVDTTNADRLRDYIRSTGADPDEVLPARMKVLVLGGTFGDARTDLCPVLAFLSGGGARFITGQLIAVDGGMRMLGA
jgi:NAD(P)-dependent dehydrogenase (short-subunit alcohol dehydrogenase family)